ncbi:hypothetical protein PVAND_013283 [Polypedilum vanderplanki]|uniref:Zinc carboxypeptidase A 1 n=1 Tax=Polypedilum vanderplanki TaxID=319348 RepID=A0A9J6CQY7_POLVA|nr:hypothetical protein PVAND_013283 [Polypedilum vanderplanki]
MEGKARYDNYRLIRVALKTDEHVKLFQELEAESDSYTFYGHARCVGQNLTIMVAAHKLYELDDLIERYKIECTVLETNIQRLIDEEEATIKPKDTPASEFDWDHYFHLETIFAWLDKQIAENDFVETLHLGLTYEGLPIRGLKISKQKGNTGIFIDACIHAREWIAPAVATYLIDQLIHSKDLAVVDLATNFDWYFVPVLNADGYKYTFEKDRLWRKNTKPYGRSRGCDLNRNFDVDFGGIGASMDKASYDFCGSHAFSEPEAAAIKKFFDDNAVKCNIKTYYTLHSFSQLYMSPFGWTKEPVKNYDDLKKIGEKAIEAIKNTHGKIYKTGSAIETIYPSSGSSRDYVYTNYDVPIVFTIELRGPPDTPALFVLPAAEIKPTCEEILNSFIAALNEARNLGYYKRE